MVSVIGKKKKNVEQDKGDQECANEIGELVTVLYMAG